MHLQRTDGMPCSSMNLASILPMYNVLQQDRQITVFPNLYMALPPSCCIQLTYVSTVLALTIPVFSKLFLKFILFTNSIRSSTLSVIHTIDFLEGTILGMT